MEINNTNTLQVFAERENISLPYAVALYAQSRLETGNFQSNIYRNALNAFGMRPASVRKQNRIDVLQTNNGDFAVYATYVDSWKDRISLDIYNNITPPAVLQDVPAYMRQVLGKGYSDNQDQYYSSWSQIFTQEYLSLDPSAENLGQTEGGRFSFFPKLNVKTFGLGFIAFLGIFIFLMKKGVLKNPFKR